MEDRNTHFTNVENFFKYYPWKFEAYDPLGRTLPENSDASMALYGDEMKQKFDLLAPVNPMQINLEISDDMQ